MKRCKRSSNINTGINIDCLFVRWSVQCIFLCNTHCQPGSLSGHMNPPTHMTHDKIWVHASERLMNTGHAATRTQTLQMRHIWVRSAGEPTGKQSRANKSGSIIEGRNTRMETKAGRWWDVGQTGVTLSLWSACTWVQVYPESGQHCRTIFKRTER